MLHVLLWILGFPQPLDPMLYIVRLFLHVLTCHLHILYTCKEKAIRSSHCPLICRNSSTLSRGILLILALCIASFCTDMFGMWVCLCSHVQFPNIPCIAILGFPSSLRLLAFCSTKAFCIPNFQTHHKWDFAYD